MYFVLAETTRSIDVLRCDTAQEAQISKLVIQTYYNLTRKISVLDQIRYNSTKFAPKSIYYMDKYWYLQIRNSVKSSIRRYEIER